MKKLGYEPADIVLVKIGDAEMEMPIGTSYTDADSGEPICCFKRSDSQDKDVVVLAINCGNITETLGIAEIHMIDAYPGFEWTFNNGLDDNEIATLREKLS